MTDIVEQATYLIHNASPSISLRVAGHIAQVLVDAGLLAEPSLTVPHRDEVAAAIAAGYEPDDPTPNRHDYRAADAVLALLAGQPTVAEVQAQALEEAAQFAEKHDVLADIWNGSQHQFVGAWLHTRAHQIREGK